MSSFEQITCRFLDHIWQFSKWWVVCVCIFVCVYVHVYLCVCMSMCMCAHCVCVCMCMYVHMSMSLCWARTCTHTRVCMWKSENHLTHGLTLFEKGCHFIGRCICQHNWPTSSQRFPCVCFPSPLRSSGITAVRCHIRLYVVSGELNSCPHTYAAVVFTHWAFSSTLSHPWVGTLPPLF